jgi:adenylate cyclase
MPDAGHERGASWQVEPIVDWLPREGRLDPDPSAWIGALAERLLAAGAPLWRLRLGFFTIHPQVAAWAYVWVRGRGTQVERFAHGVRRSAAFAGSPAQRMMESGAPLRHRLDRLSDADHPLLHELAAEGGTDYALLPLRLSDGSLNVFAVTSDRPAGFGASAGRRGRHPGGDLVCGPARFHHAERGPVLAAAHRHAQCLFRAGRRGHRAARRRDPALHRRRDADRISRRRPARPRARPPRRGIHRR